jgi:hypothetical protein
MFCRTSQLVLLLIGRSWVWLLSPRAIVLTGILLFPWILSGVCWDSTMQVITILIKQHAVKMYMRYIASSYQVWKLESNGWPHSLNPPSYCIIHRWEEASIWQMNTNISDITTKSALMMDAKKIPETLVLVQHWHGWFSAYRSHVMLYKHSVLVTERS